MLRYVAPTRPRFTYTDREGRNCETRGERRDETRRDAANRIPRVSRLRLDVNHASSGPTHAYVSLKQPVSHSSRRASLQSECSSRLRPEFGRNFVGQILTLLFFREGDAYDRFISVPKRIFRRSRRRY